LFCVLKMPGKSQGDLPGTQIPRVERFDAAYTVTVLPGTAIG